MDAGKLSDDWPLWKCQKELRGAGSLQGLVGISGMQLRGPGHLPLPEAPGTLSKPGLPRGGTARLARGAWGPPLTIHDVLLDLGPS